MEPQPAPRSEDSGMGRGSPMIKENPHSPGAAYQLRPQGHPPPRYPPINNGGPVGGGGGGGPRLGGGQQAPPVLQRLDSRSSLGSPTGPPGGQFVQPRAPFGPQRPQNPQGYQIPLSRPPLPQNPSVVSPRYPGAIPGSPGVRPPQNNFPGSRPPIYNTNQPQQIYYQPRIGDIRSQRPINPESGGPPQIRFAPSPHNPEIRHSGPQIIPDTVVTPPVRNDYPLSDPRVNQSSAGQPPRDITNDRRSQSVRNPRDKMEIIDSRSPTPGAPEFEYNKKPEDNDTSIKRKPSPRHSDDNDDDDDDVVMDREKEIDRKIGAATPRVDSPSNSYKKSASPSPIQPLEHPCSPMKVENEPRSGNISKSASPVPPEEDFKQSPQHPIDLGSEKRLHESRPSSVSSNRSPIPPRTPDHPTTLTVPGSGSSQGSPKSPKSPQGSIKGFDNGQLRSLSPKSPTPSASPASPNAPNSPAISARSDSSDKRKTTIDENSKFDGESVINNENIIMEPEKMRTMTPTTEGKPPTPSKGPERAQTPGTPDGRKSFMKRSTSGRSIKSDAGSDSGASQTRAPPTTNGTSVSPTKKMPSKSREGEKRTTAGSPVKSPSKSVKSLPRTPEAGPPSTADKKKVPMNKIQVGAAPSPNLKTVRSKIGSLDNASYKPGGGKVKIENRKLDFSKAQPKIAAKNDKYMPSGGDKKITQVKLQWNAKPKVGSLDNATYKPGGGDKKIETVKLDFKDKAKPKVGSKDNAKHVPGGGTVKSSATPPKTPQDPPNDIETQKIDVKAESKIGSLDNVKHKPGGGDKKIFNDRDYLRQTSSNVESLNGSGAQSPVPSNTISDGKNGLMPTSDENLNEEC